MKSYSKKDFDVHWFSGTGAGGQYRNKHQNSCRIIHRETGLMAVGQMSRERSENLKSAFHRLVSKLMALDDRPNERRRSQVVVRTYHLERGEVIDHSTKIISSPSKVLDGDLDQFLKNLSREGERPSSGRA